MESPPVGRYIPQKSNKRVFPGGSSIEPDIAEISRPVNRSSKSKSLKNKEVIRHEVIDVDMDEDCDIMLIEGKINTNSKGKEAITINSLETISAANLGSVDRVQSSNKSCAPGSHNIINVDALSSDLSYGDDDYMDMYFDNLMYDDEYAILQSHFDNIDIPPDIEAPIPWLPGPVLNKSRLATASSSGQSVLQIQPNTGTETSQSLWSAEPMKKKSTSKSSSTVKTTSKSSSIVKTPIHAVNRHHKVELSSPWSFAESAQSKKGIAASTSSNYLGSKVQRIGGYYKKATVFGGTSNYCPLNPMGAIKQYPGIKPSTGWSYFHNCTKNQVGSTSLFPSSYMPMEAINHTPGADAYVPNWFNLLNNKSQMVTPDYPGFVEPFNTEHVYPDEAADQPYVQEKDVNEDEILGKFQLFKKFDTVQGDSDHHFVRSGSSLKQPSKNWVKKIQEEWKILEKDLPDTIFVRVYESRMDLLRAVIVGAEGTPYHDGLFFFDVFFPSSYPNDPPHVYYHSRGLRLNPNLYVCGKVCLSLLNTWGGSQKEKWIPGVSTMLQVLVSIQGLILNTKPYFNEPGYANMSGMAIGEKNSLHYNESTFILSVKTMVYSMKKPPKHFEDFVVGHFFKHARDILVACKAYMDGAQVGCLVRGGVQDVDEGDKSCSQNFKDNLGRYVKTLVTAFTQVGVKDCDKFIPPAPTGNWQTGDSQTANRVVSPALKPVNYFHY